MGDLTVRDLIRELRKHPPDARVAWRDHDQSEGEINAPVGSVDSFNPEASFDSEFCRNVRVVLGP
jgi:hypothetical protein